MSSHSQPAVDPLVSETSHTRVSTVRARSQIPLRHTHGRAFTRHVSHSFHRECDEKSLHELLFHIHRFHRFTPSLVCTSCRETRVSGLASQPVWSMPLAFGFECPPARPLATLACVVLYPPLSGGLNGVTVSRPLHQQPGMHHPCCEHGVEPDRANRSHTHFHSRTCSHTHFHSSTRRVIRVLSPSHVTRVYLNT